MTDAAAVEAAVVDAHRRDWAWVLAATVRVARDLDLAEDCVQEAYAAALRMWASAGIPDNPAAWLTTTARRRAIDHLRRDAALRSRLPLLVEPAGALDEAAARERQQQREHAEAEEDALRAAAPDERLRLIFICCHPALAQEAQVALTLRLVCGVAVADIARAFLVSEPTMAARITRAKKKISTARIPYRIPPPGELPDRLRGALAVIHLLFTNGHTAPSGASLVRADLVDRAMHLARMLRELMPASSDVHGLYALLLVTDARRATRVDADSRLVRQPHQAAGGPGSVSVGPRRAGRGARRDRRLPAGRPAGPVRAASRHRLALRRGAHVRRDGLAADHRPVRPAHGGVALPDRGAEPRGAAGDGGRPGGRAGGGRAARARRAAVGVPVPACDQGRLAQPARPRGRGGRRLPASTRPGRQRS